MNKSRTLRLVAVLITAPLINTTCPQTPFDLDPTFRTQIDARYVASILPFPDGSILLSGQIRVPGNTNERGSAKLLPNGSFDLSFPPFPLATGGGRITPWNDRSYIGSSQTVRRLDPSGLIDPEFIQLNLGRYFTSLQGGDYHVYPDGRVLMSGAHMLSDSIRGFEGLYSLIWFSNEGYLDTTRTHRRGNGVIYAIAEQPDGRFLCTGTMTTYEGQPVKSVFRVEADGVLEPGFQPPLQFYGGAWAYHTMQDGRIIVLGALKLEGSDVVRCLIRLLPNGDLDPSFVLNDFEQTFSPSRIPIALTILPITEDRYIITGTFDKINGEDRGGIAMIDSSGNLVLDEFDGIGCGAYEYVVPSGSTTYKYISGIAPAPDGSYYIYGGYHGYDDGTTNDTTQRMVSKLYGISVGVPEWADPTVLRVFPSPSSAFLNVALPYSFPKETVITILDHLGRQIARHLVFDQVGTWDLRSLAPGCYSVHASGDGKLLFSKWIKQ